MISTKTFEIELTYIINQNKSYDSDDIIVHIKNTIQRQLQSDTVLELTNSTDVDVILYVTSSTSSSVSVAVTVIFDHPVSIEQFNYIVDNLLTHLPDIDHEYTWEEVYQGTQIRDEGIMLSYSDVRCC